MNFESNKPLFTQQVQLENNWYLDQDGYLYCEKNENRGDIIDTTKNESVSEIEATRLGISKSIKNHQSGFGTSFHQAYKNRPEIYHKFSEAEDKNNIIIDRILNIQKDQGIETLLDVACGTGNLLGKLSRANKFSKLAGIDASDSFIEYAKTNVTNDVGLFLSSAENLPFSKNTFDMCVTTWGSFSMNEAFKEMGRVVRPRGVVLRVGTAGLDDLTQLFPKYDQNIVTANLEFLNHHGFTTEKSTIEITFASLDEAKEVLSLVTGCTPDRITTTNLHHNVLISWKQIN